MHAGHTPRILGNPLWTSRLKVTTDSFHTMIVYLCKQFLGKMPVLRRQYDKTALEDAAMMSALMHSLKEEIVNLHAISAEKVDAVMELFQNGDMNLDLVLQGAIHEKSVKFTFADIPPFRSLAQDHKTDAESKLRITGIIAPQSLDEQAFNSFLEQAKLDVLSYMVWLAQVQDRDGSHAY